MAESPQAFSKQREVVRIKCSIAAELLCVNREGLAITEGWAPGCIMSLCSRGAGVEIGLDMAQDDIVCLRFRLPDTEEQLNLYGRVVGLSDGALSVKFVGLSLEESARLLRYAYREQIRIAKNQGTPAQAGEPVEDEALVIPENIRRTSTPLLLDANTEVMGTVLCGARVRVAGDIRISGNVQDAEIDAQGSVVIDGGFLGSGAGKVACGGEFRARFVQNQRIESRGNVSIEKSIISSVVLTSGDVVLGREEGTIVGGEVHAYGTVEASVIGSPRPVNTKIEVGTDPIVRLTIDRLEKRALELTARRICLLKRMAFITKDAARAAGVEEVADLEAVSVAIQAELAKIGEEIVELRMASTMKPDSVVTVYSATHPPLNISICSSRVVSDSGTGPVIYRLLEDRVVLDTWTLK